MSKMRVVAACSTVLGHFMNILFYGECGCWYEGRNRSSYYGWTKDDKP